jgi:hypothetical protein
MARSIEELNKLKVQDLRREAGILMREHNFHYLSKGFELSISDVQSHGKKADLTFHISLWEGELEKVKASEPQVTSKSEEFKLAIAKEIYSSTKAKNDLMGLREYFKTLSQLQKFVLPEFAILVSQSRQKIEQYSHGVATGEKASANVILKNRVDIMKYLRELVEADADKFNPIDDITFIDIFNDFDSALRKGMLDLSAEKFREYKASNTKSREDVKPIKVLPFIEWAKDKVSRLESLSGARWREVAIACMLLTGRRQSEVMSSGEFTLIDSNHVLFDGQLKKHTSDVVPAMRIPVLANAAKEVVEAIKWLEKHGKRSLPTERSAKGFQDAAKKSHNKCSRYISEQMQLLTEYCPITNDKTWIVEENGALVNRFKGHLTRQIYAQVASYIFNNSDNEKKISYISKILGESVEGAGMYDRDVEVKDLETIKEKYTII